jgi:acyl-CoA:acyl-CoA alkyltransferase
MRIDSIGVRVPTRRVTNDNILEMLQEHSPGTPAILLKTYQRMVQGLFKVAGSETRYFRDYRKGEKASQLITEAIGDALRQADVTVDKVDLLIYCGVGRGFLEPANAYFYAKQMGMKCSCFDIVDACMSWIRALEVSYEFFKSGRYKRILIVNGEFNSHHGIPDNYKIKDLRQLEYTFPSYTIGEAASATLLSSSDQEWEFTFKSLPELADLCTIPLAEYDNFVEPTSRMGRNGLYNFVAYGREMFNAARIHLAPLVKELVGDLDKPDIYFPHAASDAAYLSASKNINLPLHKMFANVFPVYGNIVSASIPMGMHMAIAEGRLQRGNRVVFCPASAGMVYSAVQFAF